ncbi:MAG: right-handed parallel beta-helix repeat-containing protein, partial [Ekhidna sp.]|nr:right-handed parallel beta-helix repeat-containing protein [Ekhidna sp.]
MKKSGFLFYAIVLIWLSCDTLEESVSTDSSLQLIFSTDTVSFDTLLSEKKSSTRRLSVYNPNNAAVNLSSIFLKGGQNSEYSLIINGKSELRIANEVILGRDSILILIEVNVRERDIDLPYLVSDAIVFEWNGNVDEVKLISYGQDGVRLSKQNVCNETWRSDRPYILSDTLLVVEGCELTIEKGARIYFERDAALFVQGKLTAVGDSANRIMFTNSRFDGIFDQVPGQWNGIYFLEGSSENEIAYADIFNAQVGLRVGTPDEDSDPDVIVANTRIYNMSSDGILAFTSDLNVTNCLIYNCGRYLVGNFAGGNYQYTHCTIANDQSLFISEEEFVQFSDNIILGDGQTLSEHLMVSLVNTII